MEITLIRHLPTAWNEKQLLQGRRDIPLSPPSQQDEKKIDENLQLLKKQQFDHILCSTLMRTKQTADIYDFEPEIDALLDEFDFGPFEGRTKRELFNEHGNDWVSNPLNLILGESMTNLEQRIILFLNKYSQSSTLLVFGHGSWIRALISYHKYGHINKMNKQTFDNNEYISLEFISVGV